VVSSTETVQTLTSLGERVRAARRELGMSQAQLAGEELTKGFISQVEAGLVRPSLRSLQIIAGRLGRGIEYFVGDQPLSATKRVHFHRVAAEAAAERSDWSAVRAEVNVAFGYGPARAERGKLLRILAQAELAEDQTESAFQHVNDALALLDPAADAVDVAAILHLRGTAYGRIGQLVAAIESFEAARDTIERNEVIDTRLRSRVLVALGTAYRRTNRTAKALATYEAALALATRASELDVAARSYMGIAVAHYDEGDLDAAIGAYERAKDIFERIADAAHELSVLHSLAWVHIDQGKLEEARDMAQRCRDRAAALGDDHMVAVAETELARVLLGTGDFAGAVEVAQRAERALATAHDDRQRASALRVIGAANDARKDFAASDAAYHEAIRLVTGLEHLADRSAIATEYARKLRARGQTETAYDMLELARGTPNKS
jgi:HTH-type transcriptional regulator, quorum sensing regulator NprR